MVAQGGVNFTLWDGWMAVVRRELFIAVRELNTVQRGMDRLAEGSVRDMITFDTRIQTRITYVEASLRSAQRQVEMMTRQVEDEQSPLRRNTKNLFPQQARGEKSL